MRAHTESGVTLVEVMIAMVLLTVALLGLAMAFPPSGLAVFQGRAVTSAVALAQQQMEIARGTPYGSLNTLAGTDSTTHSPYTVVTGVAVNAPAPGLTTVTVNVTAPPIRGPYIQDMGTPSVVVESFFSAP